MGRQAIFDTDQILDAVLSIVERDGMRAVTVGRVCEELDASSSSLYHRFSSRDELLIALWLRCAERFQRNYFKVLESDADPHAAARAAIRHYIECAFGKSAEMRMLMTYRQEDLASATYPATVRKWAAALTEQQNEALLRFEKRLWPSGDSDPELLRFALLRMPYTAALTELQNPGTQSHRIIDWVITAVDSLLGGTVNRRAKLRLESLAGVQ